jgi:hypothetical protein
MASILLELCLIQDKNAFRWKTRNSSLFADELPTSLFFKLGVIAQHRQRE